MPGPHTAPMSRGDARGERGERGATLVVVLAVLFLLLILALGLLAATDADLRASRAFADGTAALANADAGVDEVVWRLNLPSAAGAPPAGSRVTVNGLAGYDARIETDPLRLLSNNADDDGDGLRDNLGEMVQAREWRVRMTLTSTDVHPGTPLEVSDGNAASGPPWGPSVVLPTVQPQATWRTYTTADPADADVLVLRWKLDTDVPGLASVAHVSPQVIFWDPRLATNGKDDPTSLVGLCGDGNAANDSPYNIRCTDAGGVVRRPSGSPVLLLRVVGRTVRGVRTTARRAVETEIARLPGTTATPPFCGCESMKTGGGKFVGDSYSSSQGSYGSLPAGSHCDLGSNGPCNFDGNIAGSAFCGTKIDHAEDLTGDATAGTTISGVPGGTAYPSTSPAPRPCPCETSDVQAIADAAAAAKITNDNASLAAACRGPVLAPPSGTTCSFATGTYYFDSIDLNSATFVISATPDAPVRIYVGGDATFRNKTQVNAAGQPGSLLLAGAGSTGDKVAIKDDAIVNAVLNFPLATLEMRKRASLRGAALARVVDCGEEVSLHADEDLATTRTTLGPWRVIAWRETN